MPPQDRATVPSPDIAGQPPSLATRALRPKHVGARAAATSAEAPSEAVTAVYSEAPRPPARPVVGGYELIHSLGRGGMGTVWLARHQHTGQQVALKLVSAGGEAGSGVAERFLTEARAGSRLQHPNIVRVLHFGTADGLPFFTMELLFGGSLRDRLRRGPLMPRDAARLARQAAEAIQYAHEHKVLHRDLTPGNLMLASTDWEVNEREPEVPASADLSGEWAPADATLGVKVCDFGLARLQDAGPHQTRSGDQIGTPSYMSPEQARGDVAQVDEWTDVYGLGAVLYECLTGRPPFKAATAVETLWQVWHRDPVAVRALVPGVPRELEAVCLKCLEKDPRRRYATARQLADDLGSWLEGKPVQARPAGALNRAAKWARRNAVVATLAAAVFASLVAGVAVSSYFAVTARQEATAAEEAGRRADAKAAEAGEALGRARDQLDKTERALYVGQLSQAQHEFRDGNAARALQILAGCRPEFRHIEHHHLWSRFSALRTMTGHTAGVRGVAFSPDGRRVVSGGQDRAARVWDVETGREVLTLKGHTGSVWSVRYSPDGQRIVTGSPDGAVMVWDAATGQRLHRLLGHTDGVLAVAFSPDGNRLLSGSIDRTVRVWDAQSGRELFQLQGHSRHVTSVAFSPDGKSFLSGSWDLTLRVWDASSRRERLTLLGHRALVKCVAFSRDGSRIASGGDDHTARVWDAEDGKELLTIAGQGQAVNGVEFSPDDRRLVLGVGDSTVKVCDAGSGQAVLTLKGHVLPVTGVAFSPDGKRIVSGSGNMHDHRQPGEVTVWDAEQGQEVLTLRAHQNNVNHVAFNRHGDRFFSASQDGTVKVWDTSTCRVLLTLSGHQGTVASAAFRPDGTLIVTGGSDQTIRGWDAATGKQLFVLRAHTSNVRGIAFSPDGKSLASFAQDGTGKVWDAASWKERFPIPGHKTDVWAVAYSPDGKRIATAAGKAFETTRPGEVKLWDAQTGAQLHHLDGHTCPVFCVAFCPRGERLYSGGFDGRIKVWDAATGNGLGTMPGHTLPVKCITFTPDGKRVLTGAGDHTNPGKPGEVKVWDGENGQELFSLMGHAKGVGTVAVQPDGKRVLSGDWDAAIRVWDAHKRQEPPGR